VRIKHNFIRDILSLILFQVLAIGCESKFSEPSPKKVEANGDSLEARIKQKEEFDLAIDKIKESIDKIKFVRANVRKIQNPNDSELQEYTLVDFLSETTNDFKEKIPENDEKKLVRRGNINLPFADLSEACKNIETRLETEVIYTGQGELGKDQSKSKDGEKEEKGKRLIYYLKTCASEDKYFPALTVDAESHETKLTFTNNNIKILLQSFRLDEIINKTTQCRMFEDKFSTISNLSCENFELELSKNMVLFAKSFQFNSSGDVHIDLLGELFENQKKSAYVSIRKFADQKVLRDIRWISAGNGDSGGVNGSN